MCAGRVSDLHDERVSCSGTLGEAGTETGAQEVEAGSPASCASHNDLSSHSSRSILAACWEPNSKAFSVSLLKASISVPCRRSAAASCPVRLSTRARSQSTSRAPAVETAFTSARVLSTSQMSLSSQVSYSAVPLIRLSPPAVEVGPLTPNWDFSGVTSFIRRHSRSRALCSASSSASLSLSATGNPAQLSGDPALLSSNADSLSCGLLLESS